MPTITVTVDLPEETYQRVVALPVAEQKRITADAFAIAVNAPVEEETADEFVLTRERIESLRQGLADVEAGRVVDGDAFFTEFYQENGWTRKKL